MHRLLFTSLVLSILLSVEASTESFRLRLVAANVTSGNQQAYEAPGLRILDALDADVVMLQEFNYGANSAHDIRSMVDTAFGSGYSYYREGDAHIRASWKHAPRFRPWNSENSE